MISIFGDKNTICFICGETAGGGLYGVSIWAKGLLLTPNDRLVFLPQFISSLERDIARIESGWIDDHDSFFCYGPTTDDVVASLTLNEGHVHLLFDVSGLQLATDMAVTDFLKIYQDTVSFLKSVVA